MPQVHAELFQQFLAYDNKLPWAQQSASPKRLILWSRGHYKSSAVVVDIIQAILNFPDIRILIMQGSLGVTRKLLRQITSYFSRAASGSRLPELFPEFCGTKTQLQSTDDSFVVPTRTKKQLPQATVTVASPHSIKSGQHYDIGYFDDLVNDQNYQSQKKLDRVYEDFNLCLPLIDPPACYCIVSGTRYAFGDLYERLIRSDSEREVKVWQVSLKTCWADNGVTPRFPETVTRDGRIIGFTRAKLLVMQTDNPPMFAAQYLNQPASTASQIFDELMLNELLLDPDNSPPLSQPIMLVDLANGTTAMRDDAVILVSKTDQRGKIYIVDGDGGKWDTTTLGLQILSYALKHRPLMIYFEKSAAGISFTEYLKLLASTKQLTLPLDFLPMSNKLDAKVQRIAALTGYFRLKRLAIFRTLPCWGKLREQAVHWGGGRNQKDDYLDTIALIAQLLTSQVPFSNTRPEKHPFLAAIEAQQAVQQTLLSHLEQSRALERYSSSGGTSGLD